MTTQTELSYCVIRQELNSKTKVNALKNKLSPFQQQAIYFLTNRRAFPLYENSLKFSQNIKFWRKRKDGNVHMYLQLRYFSWVLCFTDTP